MDLKLNGARVIVSGGSRGIGRAIVKCFIEEGALVSFCARGEEGIRQTEAEMQGKAFGHTVDITNPDQVNHWVTEAAKNLGGIDIVIPNVSALASGTEAKIWRQAFETDLLGTASMVNAALPYLQASSNAAIVLISSVSGREYDMFAEPYGVLKAALIHYGKTLSAQYATKGIRVNTVSPGNVYFEDGVWGRIKRDSPELFSQCMAANPMGRMATPQEVAQATVFLASQAASFTTGTNLLVDGGLTKGVQF